MITEHVWARIREGETAAFEASITAALPIIREAEGCHGIVVRRQVEDPLVYLYLIAWTSVAAHMAFRSTDRFTEWRAQTAPFYDGAADVTHFEPPLASA